jgi:hypothetical protein
MPARKPPSPDEKPQYERFLEIAKEIGASDDPEDFERVFRQVVKPIKPGHQSPSLSDKVSKKSRV